ncbi:hypothetical protein DL95DRAFT_475987 [Leptodontidium sp. 2 PMI_412]|nr:hypothetical protein DL95DRAFT_475987 [Leptodontidium sp. 2 PMI_412]
MLRLAQVSCSGCSEVLRVLRVLRLLSSYYIALAALLESCNQPATQSPRPTRESMAQTPQKPGIIYIRLSSSPYAPSANDPVDRSAHEDRVKPEELSTALAHEFLGALCDLTRPVAGDSGIQERLEIYAAPTSYYIPLLDTTFLEVYLYAGDDEVEYG